jgi:hypothetical protein
VDPVKALAKPTAGVRYRRCAWHTRQHQDRRQYGTTTSGLYGHEKCARRAAGSPLPNHCRMQAEAPSSPLRTSEVLPHHPCVLQGAQPWAGHRQGRHPHDVSTNAAVAASGRCNGACCCGAAGLRSLSLRRPSPRRRQLCTALLRLLALGDLLLPLRLRRQSLAVARHAAPEKAQKTGVATVGVGAVGHEVALALHAQCEDQLAALRGFGGPGATDPWVGTGSGAGARRG